MDWPHVLEIAGATVATAAVALVVVPRKVNRRLCAGCGHSNIVHDPVSGRCRSSVDAGLALPRADGADRRAARCRCAGFRGERRAEAAAWSSGEPTQK
ncbi:hypothetical protein [Nocardia nova]|uniref:hypothetical protein n=1 Tax=Nocardia nova TaxID=37330 RepID=UPI0034080EA2